MNTGPGPLPQRVAAIDCGTNAIRLLIADVTTGGTATGRYRLQDVHREQRIARLGEGVDATGRLTSQAIDRAWRVLADYRAALHAAGVLHARVAATSALRDAENADEFVSMVATTLGRPPEILTGIAEAELGFAGCCADFADSTAGVVMIDVGGGSTEIVAGRPPTGSAPVTVSGAVSIDVGAVRVTERVLLGDPPTPDQVAAATDWVAGQCAAALGRLELTGVRRIVAVAGTALTVAAAALRHSRLDPALLHLATVPIDRVDRATTMLLAANRAHRAALGYVRPGRVDVIGGGALILSTVADQLRRHTGLGELTVSAHDLLDALALSQVTG